MAYTEIHPITATVEKAIAYGVNDKIKIVKDDVNDAIAYAERDKTGNVQIYKTISSYLNCSTKNPKQAFDSLQQMYGGEDKKKQFTKDGKEILAWHCIQSFEGMIEPKVANEIGMRVAQEVFGNFACVISTHTNTANTHNHFVFGAWGMNGKKYHDCNDTYRKIRQVSDRICREYGLPVMEHTEDYKLVRWTDEQGQIHYYEPTERKNAIREGQFTDANDYRNSESYLMYEKEKDTNRETIKNDIDMLLPCVSSYSELLEKLRGIGYVIKDKRKNGTWREHVSYKAPMQDKPTREDKLGDGMFYTREILTEYIEKNAERTVELDLKLEDREEYSNVVITEISNPYNNHILANIDEEYRKRSHKKKGEVSVSRGVVEKILILDVKKLNRELNEIYGDAIRSKKEKKEPTLNNRNSQYLLDCINANLRTLNFVEEKNIKTFEQIQGIVSVLYEKRNAARIELDKIKAILQKANENIALINKAAELKKYIEEQTDSEYLCYEKPGNMQILKSYEVILKQRNISEPEQQEKFKNMIERYNHTFEWLADGLKNVNEQIKMYDDCVYTLKRIDRDNSQQYTEELKSYYDLKEQQEKRKKNRDSR